MEDSSIAQSLLNMKDNIKKSSIVQRLRNKKDDSDDSDDSSESYPTPNPPKERKPSRISQRLVPFSLQCPVFVQWHNLPEWTIAVAPLLGLTNDTVHFGTGDSGWNLDEIIGHRVEGYYRDELHLATVWTHETSGVKNIYAPEAIIQAGAKNMWSQYMLPIQRDGIAGLNDQRYVLNVLGHCMSSAQDRPPRSVILRVQFIGTEETADVTETFMRAHHRHKLDEYWERLGNRPDDLPRPSLLCKAAAKIGAFHGDELPGSHTTRWWKRMWHGLRHRPAADSLQTTGYGHYSKIHRTL